jgi:uncharacterized membrane protein (UPF0127 family)
VTLRITNATRGTELASRALAARTFTSRLVGLLGRSRLEAGQGLVLEHCNSIHTAFMRFAIDAVYVDREGRVLKTVPDLKPFRVSGVLRGARSVIELPTGTIADTNTAAGDELVFETAS